MAKLSVIDLTGAKVGELDVADEVFATEVREHLLWEAVRVQRAGRRQGTASTKTRAEVNVTKDKIYRQKGTGNARHGSRRANVFRGGGVVHGPRPRTYDVGMNKKTKAAALRTALSLRAQAGNLLVVRELSMPEVKTKALASALAKLEAPKALIIDDGANDWLRMSSRNLAQADYMDVAGLNVYDILRYPKLVMSEASVKKVNERLAQTEDRSEEGAEG